eukprot:3953515-Amphidinium_carterae.1
MGYLEQSYQGVIVASKARTKKRMIRVASCRVHTYLGPDEEQWHICPMMKKGAPVYAYCRAKATGVGPIQEQLAGVVWMVHSYQCNPKLNVLPANVRDLADTGAKFHEVPGITLICGCAHCITKD